MGVCVKGMEMPTTCGKCKIKNAIECNRWKFVRSVTLDRHRDCPLVPVPLQWIPVTKQLPPAEKEVYVTDGEYIARANLLDEVFPGDKPCWSYSGLGEITHWCEQIPLPQPAKEE